MKAKTGEVIFRVYFSDTDAVGIVYHANYLDFAERARSEFSREIGLDLAKLAAQGMFFVLRSANIEYLSPAKLDDLLSVHAYVSKIGNTSVEFMHEIKNAETGTKIADVKCLLVFVNVKEGKATPTKIPQDIISKFQK